MAPTKRGELASQLALLSARLYCTSAELQYLAGELPRLARGRREFSRAQMAQSCRRLLTEAGEVSTLLDQIEAAEEEAMFRTADDATGMQAG